MADDPAAVAALITRTATAGICVDAEAAPENDRPITFIQRI
jgi:hypothetical protein